MGDIKEEWTKLVRMRSSAMGKNKNKDLDNAKIDQEGGDISEGNFDNFLSKDESRLKDTFSHQEPNKFEDEEAVGVNMGEFNGHKDYWPIAEVDNNVDITIPNKDKSSRKIAKKNRVIKKNAKLKNLDTNHTKEDAKKVASKPKVKKGMVTKTAFFTIFVIITSMAFLIISLTPTCPSFVLKAFEYIGADNAYYTVYKRIYNRNRTDENLYNVIQLSINRKEYEDMEYYINIMLSSNSFSKFARKVDDATKVALGEKYSIYANSYESYLRGNLVLAMYKRGGTLSAKMLAIDSVEGAVRELYVYVDCIKQDTSLTAKQKETELYTLQSRYKLVDMLKDKLATLDDEYSMATTDGGKLVALNQKLLIGEIILSIGEYSLNEEELNFYNEEVNNYKTEIIKLQQQ